MPQKSIPIQIVTWNVHFQGARILDALKGQPDVLALQEVTFNQRKAFKERLSKMGLKCYPDSQRRAGGKGYGNLIAIGSRLTFDPNKPRYPRENLPLPEALIQASVSVSGRSFLVISVHIPNGSRYGWKKIDTFEALNDVVREAKGNACVVAGDFNEPRYAKQDGRIVTWGQEWNARRGRFVCWGCWKDSSGRCGCGEKWDSAVRWLFEKQDEHGLQHAYWMAHGRRGMPFSHVTHGKRRWFDHVFVSRHFRVKRCEYLHEVRREKFSDHSALSARLVLDGRD